MHFNIIHWKYLHLAILFCRNFRNVKIQERNAVNFSKPARIKLIVVFRCAKLNYFLIAATLSFALHLNVNNFVHLVLLHFHPIFLLSLP